MLLDLNQTDKGHGHFADSFAFKREANSILHSLFLKNKAQIR